jgi:DNA-binding NarL/FixJ family response regulator
MAIRILLADDHTIMQAGLRALLEKEPDMDVVAEAKNGREAVSFAIDLRPDVVIIDVSMPDLNGMDATQQIVDEVPGVRVLGLSMHSDEQFVSGMFRAGAAGYLLKDCAAEELCYAIRAVYRNQTYLSPPIASIVTDEYVSHLSKAEPTGVVLLTTREREVVQLLAEGKTSKEVASGLGLSVRTVEAHRRQIMNKLGMTSVAQLTKYAIREGLTSVDY